MPQITPAALSEARIIAAYAIFAGSYLVFALGKFPGMKIDRPGAAIIGAVLMAPRPPWRLDSICYGPAKIFARCSWYCSGVIWSALYCSSSAFNFCTFSVETGGGGPGGKAYIGRGSGAFLATFGSLDFCFLCSVSADLFTGGGVGSGSLATLGSRFAVG